MADLYVDILEITEYGIREVVNEKLDPGRDIYQYEGFDFKVLYADDKFA